MAQHLSAAIAESISNIDGLVDGKSNDALGAILTGVKETLERSRTALAGTHALLHAAKSVANDCEDILSGSDMGGLDDIDVCRAFTDLLHPAILAVDPQAKSPYVTQEGEPGSCIITEGMSDAAADDCTLHEHVPKETA
jgi:hypothetical protein